MASASDYLGRAASYAVPDIYDAYKGQDPVTGIQNRLGLNVPGNPGGSVGGARPEDQWALQLVPGTNYAYDPVSGQYYQTGGIDPKTGQPIYGATQVAAAPNLAQQGAGATAMQQLYQQQQQDVLARQAATRAGQGTLAADYGAVIAGRAPSVAATQLTQGMGRIAADQASQAAGANGQNAFAARRAAAMNTARAQGDLSGQLALTRAAETTAARMGLAGLYGQEAQADAAAQNVASQTGLGYAQLGEKSEADRTGANEKAAEENLKAKGSILGGLSSIASAF